MKPYLSLTESGRARRLRNLAINALAAYDLPVARIRLVNNSCNGIFRVDTTSGEKWILRVTLPEGGHNIEHVTAEMDWMAALGRDTDLSVPHPLPARNGSLVVEAGAAGVPETRLCEVFSWVPGSDLADHLDTVNMAKLGELSARLHQHAHTYRPPAGLDLLRFDTVFPFPEPVMLFEPRQDGLFSAELERLLVKANRWVQETIDRLETEGEPMRIIHGDLHPWNVRVARGVLSPIDFEDLMWGWPVQDIATTLYYVQTEENYTELRAAFRQGYQRVEDWPEKTDGEVDAFIAARALGILNFVLVNQELVGEDLRSFAARTEKRLRQLMPGR